MRNLRALEQRIDRNMDQPGPRGGERHQASQFALGSPARNPRSGLPNFAKEPTGQAGDTIP